MKQTNQSFSFSVSLFKESMRKGWLISLTFFVALVSTSTLFFTGAGLDQFIENEGYVGYNVEHIPVYYYIILGLLAICSAIYSFNYMHSKAVSVSIHSLPLNRSKIFITQFTSGLIIVSLPVIINGIVLLVFANRLTGRAEELISKGYFDKGIDPLRNMMSISEILSFLGISLIAVILSYSLSVLAGIIAGNLISQAIVAIILNSALVAIAYCIKELSSIFIFGYATLPEYIKGSQGFFADLITGDSLIQHLHPLYYAVTNYGVGSWAFLLAWLLISCAIALLAYLLYTKAKLERSGENAIYKFSNNITTIIISFVAMVSVGVLIPDFIPGYYQFAFPFVVTGILTFLVCQMVLHKKINIFDVDLVKRLCVFAGVVVILIAVPIFDLGGFERKVPEVSAIKNVTIDYDSVDNAGAMDAFDKKLIIKEKANIESIVNYHKKILDKQKEVETAMKKEIESSYDDVDDYEILRVIKFVYTLENGTVMARGYSVPDMLFTDESFAKVVTSDEYKKQNLLKYGLKGEVTRISSMSYISRDGSQSQGFDLTDNEVNELSQILDEDYMNLTFEQMAGLPEYDILTEMEIFFTPDKGLAEVPASSFGEIDYGLVTGSNTLAYRVTPNYKKAIKWFKSHGYYETIYDEYISLKEETTN